MGRPLRADARDAYKTDTARGRSWWALLGRLSLSRPLLQTDVSAALLDYLDEGELRPRAWMNNP
jgi:hypothetical protein